MIEIYPKLIHVLPHELIPFNEIKQKPEFKPEGLWYSPENTWVDWCENRGFRLEGIAFYYEIEIYLEKILSIDNRAKFLDFFERFNTKLAPEIEIIRYIDWEAVSKEYFGIQIIPYLWEFRHSHIWYNPWDVASGCIWNWEAIKSYKCIKIKNLEEYNPNG